MADHADKHHERATEFASAAQAGLGGSEADVENAQDYALIALTEAVLSVEATLREKT